MRFLLILAACCAAIQVLYAQPILKEQQAPAPSPLHTVAVAERNFINLLAGRGIVLRHITTSPTGINGKPNELIRATYGGNERLCAGTGAGPGAMTTWACVTLGAP